MLAPSFPRSRTAAVFATVLAAALAPSGCAGDGDTPIADAGSDLSVGPGETVTLVGNASTDPNGDPLTYSWRFDSVPPQSIVENSDFSANDDAGAVEVTFVPDVPGMYGITLQVSDGENASDLDYLVVTAGTGNHPPVADAGEDQYSATGDIAYLYGAGIDEDVGDVLTYRWKFELVPLESDLTDQNINNQGTPTPAIIPDAIGLYVLTLSVSDGEVWSEPDFVTVIVDDGNLAPIADAGDSDILTPCAGEEIALDGRASYDPEGQDITYAWDVLDAPTGSAAAFDDPTSSTPTLSWDVVGYYTIRLVVNDGEKDSAADYLVLSTTATDPNQDPVADAGADVLIDSTAFCLGASCSPCSERTITLDAGASADPDHDPLSYQWAVLTGTGYELIADQNDVASLTIPQLTTTLGNVATAVYEVELTVADCQGQDSDVITITFNCHGG